MDPIPAGHDISKVPALSARKKQRTNHKYTHTYMHTYTSVTTRQCVQRPRRQEGGIQVEEGGIQVEVLAQKGSSQRQNSAGPKHRRSGACAVSFVQLLGGW